MSGSLGAAEAAVIIAQLEHQVATLIEALEKRSHDRHCSSNYATTCGDSQRCDCGLDAALASVRGKACIRGEEKCTKCHQPKVHPFHAPKGIFGGQMETHEFRKDQT